MSTADQSKPRLIEVKYPSAVRRCTVQMDGNEWQIVHQVLIPSMTLCSPDPLPSGEQSRGFWIEATDGKGGIYHREVMPDPHLGMEQFDEGGEIRRINHPLHKVSLEILLPDLPEVSELHLISNPPIIIEKPDKQGRSKRIVLKLPREPGDQTPDHPNVGHQH